MKFNLYPLLRILLVALLVDNLMVICEFDQTFRFFAMVALGTCWGSFDPCLTPLKEEQKDDTQV